MEKTDNPSIRIYVNRIENTIAFKNRRVHYLELLTPETMKLPRSTDKKICIEKFSHLEITKVVLVHCNFVNNDYQQDSRILIIFVLNYYKLKGRRYTVYNSNWNLLMADVF